MSAPERYVRLSDSAQFRDRTPTELEYIKLEYENVAAAIAGQKNHHWQIVRWAATIDVAAVGFAYGANIAISKFLVGAAILFAGAIATVNFLAVQRDLDGHRRTLLSLREFMGGFVEALYAGGRDEYLEGTWLKDVKRVQLGIILLASLVAALLILIK